MYANNESTNATSLLELSGGLYGEPLTDVRTVAASYRCFEGVLPPLTTGAGGSPGKKKRITKDFEFAVPYISPL